MGAAGMHWLVSVVDQTARYWFMHHVSLADLIHPGDEIGRELLEFCETEWKQQEPPESSEDYIGRQHSLH